jgi:hypothetical protein
MATTRTLTAAAFAPSSFYHDNLVLPLCLDSLSNHRDEEFVIKPGQSDEILEDSQALRHVLFGGQDGSTIWPHLHFLLLNNLPIQQNALIDLIRCHAVSLRGIILENYNISFELH